MCLSYSIPHQILYFRFYVSDTEFLFSQGTDQELSSVQFLTITAVFVALTYIFTAFINVKLPIAANGGLIHLGNVPLFIGAILFGKKTGAIAGGIGMGLFDLLSGWTLWLFIFLIRFFLLQGLMV